MSARWRPEIGDSYWYIDMLVGHIYVETKEMWSDSKQDERRISAGNCFKTKEQAEEVLEKIKKVLMEVHDRSENEGDK